jgi:2-phosphosulfolactate phosphatase
VHILCAGTRGEISLDDCLPAGAIAESLVLAGRELVTDDAARLCIEAFRNARRRAADPDAGILQAMRESRGGRNLIRLNLNDDIMQCSRRDTLHIIPVFNPADRTIRPLAQRATEIAP